MQTSVPAIQIKNLDKTYDNGFQALHDISVDIRRGEIFALLGPNGAGKTTLINIICGLVNPGKGQVLVNGYDIVRDYRAARKHIGLVPQELTTDSFETLWNTIRLSRGLFGKAYDAAILEESLRKLSLWDKRDSRIRTLSGGMKRRVMIAKALSHEPDILFLDEPTAGVDVTLRKDMWSLVRSLQRTGVTIILTTHYIEEAEEMADRVGIIDQGRLMLIEEKHQLMRRFAQKRLIIQLQQPLSEIPAGLRAWPLQLCPDQKTLHYHYDHPERGAAIQELMADLHKNGLLVQDIETEQRSLEDIFVQLTGKSPA